MCNIPNKLKVVSKCNQCDNSLFRTPTFKNDHTKVVHLGIRFNCLDDSCKKSFISQNALKTHLKIHNEIPTKMCHVCLKSFVHQKYLKKHELNRHLKVVDKKWSVLNVEKCLQEKIT